MVPAWKHLDYYWEHRHDLFVSPSVDDSLDNSAYRPWSTKMPIYADPVAVQEWTATHYALVEEIDDWVGALLDELDASSEANNNAIIIFTSDHGELLGAHGMRDKNKFYEESSKVPLFIAFDGVIDPGTVVDAPVSHLDIVATILDYIDATFGDNADGNSLRPLIENRNYNNEGYDDDFVVAEWDYRMPIIALSTGQSSFDRTIDERPSLMVRKGPYKLMMQKLASSNKIDIMYDLRNDPYEVYNLSGSNSEQATISTLSKAEHLRCLLLEWMERHDGDDDEGYYSSPLANYGQGQGDIAELRQRQSWPALDFWIGDDSIEMGELGSRNGNWLIRSEYLYIGSRVVVDAAAAASNDDITMVSFSISGPHADYFHLDRTQMSIDPQQCQSIKITFIVMETIFRSIRTSRFEAFITISRDDGQDDIIVPVTVSVGTNN